MENLENSIRISNLISRYLQEKITQEEEAELMNWVRASNENERMFKELTDNQHLKTELAFFERLDLAKAYKKTMSSCEGLSPVRSFWSFKRNGWKVAAAILLLLAGGWLIGLINQRDQSAGISEKNNTTPATITPGGNKAFLTLADGRNIILDSSADGELAKQGNVLIRKENGKLAYSIGNGNSEQLFNTVRTPNGGQYMLELADGTKVWLNAASSLKFPATFSGNERRVEMTGEVYFEIAKNAKQPFIVRSNEIDIRVTGTHFNINAYPDEGSTSTTLLEGAVDISDGGKWIRLHPGEQARSVPGQPLTLMKNTDLEEVMAWKKGKFIFNQADIRKIMRQISRWYDVEIVYQGSVSQETFSGMVSRDSDIDKVLRIIEEGGVKFNIKSRKIIVQ